MTARPTLHFFCGKMAAGKSTLAGKLARQYDAVLISEDDWLMQLYPTEITDISGYIHYSRRLRSLLTEHIQALLVRGLTVVLDFPANTMQQRDWFRTLFEKSQADHVLHFIDVSNETCKQQLKQRSRHKQEGQAFTSETDFDCITRYFQPPAEAEGFNIEKYPNVAQI